MKKLVFACLAVASFCSLGQVAKADYYGRRGYYHGHGNYYGRHYGYYRPYGYYPFYGPRVYVDTYFYAPPPPVYYCPPPRPPVYEGRVVPETRAPEPDYSK